MAVTYSKETKHLFLTLMEAILESLGLGKKATKKKTGEEEDNIVEKLEDGSQLMVVNCYPPCPEPELTLGMPPHSDYGFLTLVLQDDIPGLQIQFQGKWFTVEPLANSFVVNIGDHLEVAFLPITINQLSVHINFCRVDFINRILSIFINLS